MNVWRNTIIAWMFAACAGLAAGVASAQSSDFKVASVGGDISGSALSAQLASGNVTISSANGVTSGNGDVYIDDVLNWSSSYTLTIVAARNIYIRNHVVASGDTAGLVLGYGASGDYSLSGGRVQLLGTSPLLKIGTVGAETIYTVINAVGTPGDANPKALQAMVWNMGGSFALGQNIDATSMSFSSIGSQLAFFTGRFTGLNNSIIGLTIDGTSQTNHTGLFAITSSGSTVRDLRLTGLNVRNDGGSAMAGGLAGANQGMIRNVSVDGTISSLNQSGGITGRNSGTILESSSSASTFGSQSGSLVGLNVGTISNSFAIGAASKRAGSGTYSYIGGLVGVNAGPITNAYASGQVNAPGFGEVGGLTANNGSTILSSYWDTQTSTQMSSSGGAAKTTLQMRQQATFVGWSFPSTWRIDEGSTYPYFPSTTSQPTDTTAPVLSTFFVTPPTWAVSSSEAATAYWIVIPRGAIAPSKAQVKAGVSYVTVTATSHGTNALANGGSTYVNITGLVTGTPYDVYLMAEDASGNQSAILMTPMQFGTNGACGTAAGIATATQPTTNLCALGTATSAISNPPNWTWTCVGSNAGTDANCVAPIAATPTIAPLSLRGNLSATQSTAHGDGHLGDRTAHLAVDSHALVLACNVAACPWTASTTVPWIKIDSTSGTSTGSSGVGSGNYLLLNVDPWEGLESTRTGLISVNDGSGITKQWTILQKPLTDWDQDGVPDEWEQRGYPMPNGVRRSLSGYFMENGVQVLQDHAPYGRIVETEPITAQEKLDAKLKRDIWLWIDEMDGTASVSRLRKNTLPEVARIFSLQGIRLIYQFGRSQIDAPAQSYTLPYSVPLLGTELESIQAVPALKTYGFSKPPHQYRNIVYQHVVWGGGFGSSSPSNSGAICDQPTKMLGANGVSRYGSNSVFIAADPCGGSTLVADDTQVRTLFHELGHTFGLGHGGPWFETAAKAIGGNLWLEGDYDPDRNFKPNMLSTMNYRYGYTPIISRASEPTNYSSNNWDDVNEGNLASFWAKPLTINGVGTQEYGLIFPCQSLLGSEVVSPIVAKPGQSTSCGTYGKPNVADLDRNSTYAEVHVAKSEWDHIWLGLSPGFVASQFGFGLANATERVARADLAFLQQELEPNVTQHTLPLDFRVDLSTPTAQPQELKIVPGQNATIVIGIENQGFRRDTYSFALLSASNFTFSGLSSLTLEPGQKVWLSFTITAPSSWATQRELVRLEAKSELSGFNLSSKVAWEVMPGTDSGPAVQIPVEDRTPNDFTFSALMNAAPDTYNESASTVLSGFDVTLPIQVRGGEMSINGSPYSQYISNVNSGDTLRLRAVSSAIGGDTRTVEVAVGGLVRTFDVKTMLTCGLDIDGDTNISAAKDGVLLNRYFLGYRGDALVAGLNLTGSHSSAQAITDFIGTGSKYDVFGRGAGSPSATTDGLVLTRLMLGMPDSALLSGIAIPLNASFTSASAVRTFVNTKCGTNLGSP